VCLTIYRDDGHDTALHKANFKKITVVTRPHYVAVFHFRFKKEPGQTSAFAFCIPEWPEVLLKKKKKKTNEKKINQSKIILAQLRQNDLYLSIQIINKETIL